MNQATADAGEAVPSSAPGPRGQSNAVRRARLITGLVLLAFVSTHLINHALGLISLAAMESGRGLFLALWRSPPGAALLLGSLLAHLGLAFWSIYQRRHLRMPLWEALQLLLGVCIPVFLIDHAVSTGAANARYGYQDSYTMLVLLYWKLRPDIGISQALLLTIAWTHGAIGIHFWLRLRPWYPRLRRLRFF